MKLKRLNSAVSMFIRPALGSPESKTRYMALAVDKSTLKHKIKYGVAREITESSGSVDISGFLDKSKLIIVKSEDLINWEKVSDLGIRRIENIIKKIHPKDSIFIGLEDPDIINEDGTKHLYFTIAFKPKNKIKYNVFLGHAKGKGLDTLKATMPVLSPVREIEGFKELCPSPVKVKNKKLNLNESQIIRDNEETQLITLNSFTDLSKKWKFEKVVLDPSNLSQSWCNYHASPCRIFPRTMIDSGNDYLVGILNGREKPAYKDDKKYYGKFRPGLFLFDPKTGEIPWVADKPLFEDPKATTITFASDYVPLDKDNILLYAHPNDSFVRAYKINLKELKKMIPKEIG